MLYIESEQKSAYEALIQQADLDNLTLTDDKSQANIILADPPQIADKLDQFPNLTWLQSTFAGVDALVKPNLRRDYQLTNIKGRFGQLISEYVIGYTLSYFRHFERYAEQQKAQVWQPIPYQSIQDKTMLIIGTGSIGRHLACSAHALGFNVIGVNQSGQIESLHQFSQIMTSDQLGDALAQADIIVNTLPKTDQTTNLFNQEAFNRCQQALFFNVGRGDTVETQALLDALDKGQVAHAFLDVFKQEPISQACPYWQHPSVTVTPHIAANSFPEDVIETFVQNYQQWSHERHLNNLVDFEKGY